MTPTVEELARLCAEKADLSEVPDWAERSNMERAIALAVRAVLDEVKKRTPLHEPSILAAAMKDLEGK